MMMFPFEFKRLASLDSFFKDVKKMINSCEEEKEKSISYKKKNKINVDELKHVSAWPDVVIEVWDATSADPKFWCF